MNDRPSGVDSASDPQGFCSTDMVASGLVTDKAEQEEVSMSVANFAGETTSQRPVSLLGWGVMIVGGAAIWAVLMALFL